MHIHHHTYIAEQTNQHSLRYLINRCMLMCLIMRMCDGSCQCADANGHLAIEVCMHGRNVSSFCCHNHLVCIATCMQTLILLDVLSVQCFASWWGKRFLIQAVPGGKNWPSTCKALVVQVHGSYSANCFPHLIASLSDCKWKKNVN